MNLAIISICLLASFLIATECPTIEKPVKLQGKTLIESLAIQKSLESVNMSLKNILDDIFRSEYGFSQNADISQFISMDFYIRTANNNPLAGYLIAQKTLSELNFDSQPDFINVKKETAKHNYKTALAAYRERIVAHDPDWCKSESLINMAEREQQFVNTKKYNQLKEQLQHFELPRFLEGTVTIKDSNFNVIDVKSKVFAVPYLYQMRKKVKETGYDDNDVDYILVNITDVIIDLNEKIDKKFYIEIDGEEQYTLHYINDELGITINKPIDLNKTSESTYNDSFQKDNQKYSFEVELREVYIKDGLNK